MTRAELIRAAVQLVPPSPAAAAELAAIQESLGLDLGQQLLAQLAASAGTDLAQREMLVDNSRNMVRFVAALCQHFEATVLVDTALWALRTYSARGLPPDFFSLHVRTLQELLRQRLSPRAAAQVLPVSTWLLQYIPAMLTLAEQELARMNG